MFKIEQLNIVGKRSGQGFVVHKATLVNALSRALAERVMLMDFNIGRKGLLGYTKALSGSNIIKIVPDSGSASGERTSDKRLKVTCGNNTSYLDDSAWIGDKTPMTLCEVRVSPANIVKPNIGNTELAEALDRVLPFTTKEDNKPVLQCVLFRAKEGKLTLTSADGFRLATTSLDYDGEGTVLINRDDLWGIANALRKARRANIGFEKSGDTLDGVRLVVDTDLIRYKLTGADGTFPEYEKLIPTEHKSNARFDSVEALKALSALKVVADSKAYPIDLHLNGGLVMSCADDKSVATIPAETEGQEVTIRVDGLYLQQALRACGGMLDFKVIDASKPMVFETEALQVVTMPMFRTPKAEPKAEAEATEAEKAQAVAEAEAITKSNKPKRKHKTKEPVAV